MTGFGQKGDSDVGAKLLWIVSVGGGAIAALFGVGMMIAAGYTHDFGNVALTFAGVAFLVVGVAFLGALGFIFRRFGRH